MFIKGIKHGNGMIMLKNTEIYLGQFRRNMFNGLGVYYYKDGGYYVGQFNDNLKNGPGYHQSPNGERQMQIWNTDILLCEEATKEIEFTYEADRFKMWEKVDFKYLENLHEQPENFTEEDLILLKSENEDLYKLVVENNIGLMACFHEKKDYFYLKAVFSKYKELKKEN